MTRLASVCIGILAGVSVLSGCSAERGIKAETDGCLRGQVETEITNIVPDADRFAGFRRGGWTYWTIRDGKTGDVGQWRQRYDRIEAMDDSSADMADHPRIEPVGGEDPEALKAALASMRCYEGFRAPWR